MIPIAAVYLVTVVVIVVAAPVVAVAQGRQHSRRSKQALRPTQRPSMRNRVACATYDP